MTKIELMTAEQEAALIEFREKWLAIGRATEPADRVKAEVAITRMYVLMGEEPPRFWWCDGPASGSIIRMIISSKPEANLAANLRANLAANLAANLNWSFWGQHECYWQAWAMFAHLYLRPMHTEDQIRTLTLWLYLSESCGWWQPFRGICFICERPERQLTDADGRLHCENGPAILCRDGWPVYAWHNVRVPAQVIEAPESLTAEQITKEENAEVRRVMLERFGFERFVRDAGGSVLSTATLRGNFPEYLNTGEAREFVGFHRGKETIRLIRTSLKRGDDKLLTFVHVKCPSTAREYYLRVNPDHTDAVEAIASTFQMTAAEYRGMIQHS